MNAKAKKEAAKPKMPTPKEQKAGEVSVSELRSKIAAKKHNFKVSDYAVYPSHGIGKIIDIETTEILGQDYSCYLMYFEKERLTIKVPVQNSKKIGLRPLVSKEQMEEVFTILRSGVKKMKGMWSRRAQEYEAKINSGDIIELSEVLRDLARDIADGERSYSERIIYETAVARLAMEYAAIHKIDFDEAKAVVISTAKDKLGVTEEGSEAKLAKPDDFDDEFDDEEEFEDEDEDGDDEEDDE